MGVGRGYGKLLLFGEHAAVYGHPAVGLRLEEYLEVELVAPREGNRQDAAAAPAEWVLPPLEPREAELVQNALDALPVRVTPGELRIHGTLPMSVGFGSSAAFCTALLCAAGFGGDRLELWAEAHRLEHVFHGTPSGIDTGLSVFPGASVVYPDPPGLPSREPAALPRAWLVFGAIPRTSSTAALVAGVRSLREQDSARAERTLHRLGELSRLAATPARCPDAGALGAFADEAQQRLRALGLSTSELDSVLDFLRESGAAGAKLSGAGGGGAFYGVFETEEAASDAVSLARQALPRSVTLLHLGVVAPST